MIYHVLPGDAVAGVFSNANIDGKVIVCREALVDGPIDAEDLDDLWHERAQFIVTGYGEDEIEYHEKVAGPLSRLADLESDDEVNLWFEYELFCSVNMWFCLSLLEHTAAKVYRVEPIGLDEENKWDGFGKFEVDDLKACFELRAELSKEEVTFGAALWNAYRKKDYDTLRDLGRDDLPCFPHLKEVVAAAVTQDSQPIETLRAIIEGGETDFEKVFVEFKKRAGVYGYGDLQVERLMQDL